MKRKIAGLFLVMALILTGIVECEFHAEIQDREITSDIVTRVSFLDVGQGDSVLIELSNGEVMLIDASEKKYYETISDTLDSKGIVKIDYLVATHPHSDHIGSMAKIIENYEIGTFYMPNVTHTSKTFESMLIALDEMSVDSKLAKAGDIIFDSGELKAEVLSPVSDKYEELNDYSVVIKLTCGKKSFLFTGDAEVYAENLITADVDSDVLKVGHHGSVTSTGKKFLDRVSPYYAVISCGAGNSYGHPHDEIIELFESKNIPVYRTDIDGTVVMICDGENINIIGE